MLLKINDSWVDIAALDHTFDADPDQAGPGAVTHYRGEAGFVCFQLAESRERLVLVNARHVWALEGGPATTTIKTTRGELTVSGSPEWVANILNHARRFAAAA